MKERGILFGAQMVRAIAGNTQSQTRRPIASLLGFGRITEFGSSDTAGYDWHFRDKRGLWNDISTERLMQACPYGMPGDRLWVRESWAHSFDIVQYAANNDSVLRRTGTGWIHEPVRGLPYVEPKRWRSSRFMPRWASRFLFEIEQVRVQPVQAITEADAIAEGMGSPITRDCKVPKFAALWDQLHGKGAWSRNGWVWALSFRRVGEMT